MDIWNNIVSESGKYLHKKRRQYFAAFLEKEESLFMEIFFEDRTEGLPFKSPGRREGACERT
jgi:hypothetical protein